MAKIDLKEIIKGKSFQICAIVKNDRCYFEDFVKSLEQSDRKKIYALLERTSKNGTPGNVSKFKKLQKVGICEFKSNQVRIFCFFDKNNTSRLIILLDGYNKKSNKTKTNQIEKAKRLKDLYSSYERR